MFVEAEDNLYNKMDWKKAFKKDIKVKLDYANREYKKYRTEGNLIYLQQAGNKLFSAVENYLMIKYGKRVRNYAKLLNMVNSNKNDSRLLTQAVQLHYFFYNADLHMDRYTAEVIFLDVYNKLKNRIRGNKR